MSRARLAPVFVGITLAFIAAMVAVAGVSAWPIYVEWHYVIAVVVAAVVGAGIALLGAVRRLGVAMVTLLVVVAYLLLGVPVALPTSLTGVADILSGFLSLTTATWQSWKQLVTISTLPVGDYQTLLVPAFIVVLVGTTLAASIAMRARRAWPLVALVALGMSAFGIVFGSPRESGALYVGGFGLPGPRELVLGLIAFGVALVYLLWRGTYDRRVAIRAARATATVRRTRGAAASSARRAGLAAATVVIALLVAVAATPGLGAVTDRRVLRSAVTPVRLDEVADSPLSDYRSFFTGAAGSTDTGAGSLYGTDLLTVQQSGLGAGELRLAVLSHYDGEVFRAVDPTVDDAAADFVRVPAGLDPGVDGPTGTATVTLTSPLVGSWLPTLLDMRQIDFRGSSARQNADGFFYNQQLQAGVVAGGGVGVDDTWTMTAVKAEQTDPSALPAPAHDGGSDEATVPDSLVKWLTAQKTDDLGELITRLRGRGYLSHSLADGADTQWFEHSGEEDAQPSRAGHSTYRIADLFDDLNTQETKVAAAGRGSKVAAVGDDEQFAVASALIAERLGYDARVVLGFRIGDWQLDPDSDEPACADTCKGQNLAAWIEVRGATGQWVSVDTTPQHVRSITQIQTEQTLPQYPTDVDPESATREQPQAGDQSTGETTPPDRGNGGLDLAWLATTLRIVGLSLLVVLVVLAPFAAVLGTKLRRRLRRRRAARSEDRIVGGWDEYVDSALDHGLGVRDTQTRLQVATSVGTTHAATLAVMADRAVFGAVDPADAESEEFWRLVDEDRLEFARGMSAPRRWLAALSLRSFRRHLPDVPRVRGRGRRRGASG